MQRAPQRVRLKDKRRRALSIKAGISGLVVVLLLGALAYAVRLPALTISHVSVEGAVRTDAAAVQTTADAYLSGTYALLVPRRMSLAAPLAALEGRVLQDFPQVAAVNISRTDMTQITIRLTERVEEARWCLPEQAGAESCYALDTAGFIYGPSVGSTGREYRGEVEGEPVGKLFLSGGYGALDAYITDVESATKRKVQRVAIAGGDVAATFEGGGEIRFLLAEMDSATLANIAAVFTSPEFAVDKLLYADFRFDQKAIVKFTD